MSPNEKSEREGPGGISGHTAAYWPLPVAWDRPRCQLLDHPEHPTDSGRRQIRLGLRSHRGGGSKLFRKTTVVQSKVCALQHRLVRPVKPASFCLSLKRSEDRAAVRISAQGVPPARAGQSQDECDDDEHSADSDARVATPGVLGDHVSRVSRKERRQRVCWLREVQHTCHDSGYSYDEQDYRQDTSHQLTLPDLGSENACRVDGCQPGGEGRRIDAGRVPSRSSGSGSSWSVSRARGNRARSERSARAPSESARVSHSLVVARPLRPGVDCLPAIGAAPPVSEPPGRS